MVDMGTMYLERNPLGASDEVTAALTAAMHSAAVTQIPVAEFAGYSWTPGPRAVGTSTFVTTYGSTQEARAVGAVLYAVWPALADIEFAGAGTTVDGQVVITAMAEVGPTEFSLPRPNHPRLPGAGQRPLSRPAGVQKQSWTSTNSAGPPRQAMPAQHAVVAQ